MKAVEAGADGKNADVGKLFANKKADEGGDAAAAGKAAAAVAAVSGEQILKAIVDAAGKDGAEKAGVDNVKDATNPIAAAIGGTGNDAAAAFAKDGMKKDDQIAAAMVLRGMAKGGQFALKSAAHAEHKGTVKNAVESATNKTVTALSNLVRKAVQAGLKKIGDVVKAKDGASAKGGDKESVNGIANEIKGIVDAAGNAGDEGKLKAAAVAAVSGEQILKAIVDAAGKGEKEKKGVKAADATNPIDAAIGSTDADAAAFTDAAMIRLLLLWCCGGWLRMGSLL
ncbi:variable large family protein [Borreliella yangtzensis]|uniref:Variable large protein n=1 Tax=Borreliella yangtzensis TaxID=683292 RepID=A0ABR6PAR2_9SPIR|nr:hypothetical protein [Borreliella yangtzensis]MBB6043363.1 hypothetical protein [Borreliella yangtzensis]